MSLFDNEDFEKVINDIDGSVPDGVIDGTEYVKIFVGFVDHLASLNPEDEQSRILFMMNVMNLVDSNDEASAYEVISACCYHIVTLLGSATRFNSDIKDNYLRMLYNEVIPNLTEDAKSMPYWD